VAAEVEFIESGEAFFETSKGWAFFPFQSEVIPLDRVDGASFHVVKTLPGEVRGNHRHPGVEEWLHVFGGPAVFHWGLDNGGVGRRDLDNEQTVIRVKAGVAHALSNPGPNPVFLVSFRTKPQDPEAPASEPAELL